MSTDTPRPERVTLTDEEIAFVYNWTPTIADARDAFVKELTGFFAAREQALREERDAEREALIDMLRTSFHAIENITRPTLEGDTR